MRKIWGVGIAALLAACAGEAETTTRSQAIGPASQGETEPNAAFDTATPLVLDAGGAARVVANVYANSDVDVYSFEASAGDRLYAATMTSASASGSVDSILEVVGADGATVIETDQDDGSFAATSSTVAGVTFGAAGTYFLRVRQNGTGHLRPYHLWVQLRTGLVVGESESNDVLPGQPLPAGGWVAGTTASVADVDMFAVDLAAGDTVFASLDLDPDRDTIEWNGTLQFTSLGEAPLVAADPGSATPDSEALFITVKDAGTYYLSVISASGAGSYVLSTTVLPRGDDSACTTYASTNVPVAIPSGPGAITSTLTIPDGVLIGDLEVALDINHTFMSDLDVELTSPSGNTVALFNDVGPSTVSDRKLDVVLADEAALPIQISSVTPAIDGFHFMPELTSRLEWFDGQATAGTWTLTVATMLPAMPARSTAGACGSARSRPPRASRAHRPT